MGLGPDATATAQDEFRYGPDGERYYTARGGLLRPACRPDVLGIAAGQDDGRTRRGFMGSEQLDRTGLVHMGGRPYDP